MSQINRLSGGQIDRSQILDFTFDGKAYQGHAGDTLASALAPGLAPNQSVDIHAAVAGVDVNSTAHAFEQHAPVG